MKQQKIEYKDVDAYIAAQPESVQDLLQQFRDTIRKAAPKAEEVISYAMPAYKHHGMLVYFAAWKSHIGFYAVPSGIEAFKTDLAPYTVSKGTVQFPFDKPIPLKLVTKIVKFRIAENEEKAKLKTDAKAKPKK